MSTVPVTGALTVCAKPDCNAYTTTHKTAEDRWHGRNKQPFVHIYSQKGKMIESVFATFHKQIGHNALEWLLQIRSHVSREPCELESSFLVQQ